jgi:hypothetical protein
MTTSIRGTPYTTRHVPDGHGISPRRDIADADLSSINRDGALGVGDDFSQPGRSNLPRQLPTTTHDDKETTR